MKILNVHGIKLSEAEEMAFSKYVSNNNIALNTMTSQERHDFVLNWLEKHLSDKHPVS